MRQHEGFAVQADAVIDRVGTTAELDPFADWLSSEVSQITQKGGLKSTLSGTWLAHPLHPLLTDVTIGSLVSATLLTVIGSRHARRSADLLTAVGVLSAVPTIASGLSDWSESFGSERRIGLFHAACNAVGIGAYIVSLGSAMKHHRLRTMLIRLFGLGALTAGGYVGGYMSYRQGLGVNRNAFTQYPDDWTTVMDVDALKDNTLTKVDVGGSAVVLYRRGASTYALSNSCSHAGGPLDEGSVDDELCISCPWHGSRFSLKDGSAQCGPATAPQPHFSVRHHQGKLQIRRTDTAIE